MIKTSKTTFISGIKAGVPIALGYFAVSFAFGVTAVSKGLHSLIATFMSMTNLTSAGQLAGLSIVAICGSVIEIIITQLVINARYFLMSLSLSQKLDPKFRLLDRFLCAFGVTDEIFAVASAKEGKIEPKYMYGLILLPFLGWTLGTLSGALLGNVMPPIIMNALSLALYAMFIAIIIPACMNNKKLFPVVLISTALSCIIFFVPVLKSVISEGIAYVIAGLIASAIGAIIFPIEEQPNKEGENND
jgi:4-azaleucine resistance transporter AzlC